VYAPISDPAAQHTESSRIAASVSSNSAGRSSNRLRAPSLGTMTARGT